MLFRQLSVFKVEGNVNSDSHYWSENHEPLRFHPCLPSFPTSLGWIPPVDEEDAPLVVSVQSSLIFCLQVEEKILPASVITNALKEGVKELERSENRKIRKKEKLTLKEDIRDTLLPRAFSRYQRIYGYLDLKNRWLIINTVSDKQVNLFIDYLKKTMGDIFKPLDLIPPSPIMTAWLKQKEISKLFSIDQYCVLQDPQQEKRVIRCQYQNLFNESVQSFLTDGCHVNQLAVVWNDKLRFVLTHDFKLKSLSLIDDDVIDLYDGLETRSQKFVADFLMSHNLISEILIELLPYFSNQIDQTSNQYAVAI